MRDIIVSLTGIFLVLNFVSCNDNSVNTAEDDLATFREHIAKNMSLDSSNIYFYSYPIKDEKVKIYANNNLILDSRISCDSLPGCFLALVKKKNDTTLIRIVNNRNLDTIFNVSNDRICKIIVDFNLDINLNKYRIFTNEDKNAWNFEY